MATIEIDQTLLTQAKAAKAASRKLAGLPTPVKNRALERIAEALRRAPGRNPRRERAGPRTRARRRAGRRAPQPPQADAGEDRQPSPPTFARSRVCPTRSARCSTAGDLPNGLQVSRRRVPLGVSPPVSKAAPT